jgi:hypothetical protein
VGQPSLSSDDAVVPRIDGTVSAVEIEAEAIAVAEQASSLTMSPDYFEEDTGPAPRRNGLQNGLCYSPPCSAVEKQVPYAI